MIPVRWRAVALGATAALAFAPAAFGQSPGIGPSSAITSLTGQTNSDYLRWVSAPGQEAKAVVEAYGVRPLDGTSPSLEVYATSENVDSWPGQTPMAGTLSLTGTTLRFTPRFPLDHGVYYTAILRNPEPGGMQTLGWAKFKLPERPATAPTKVAAVYPETDVLPDNLLKFYIYFSGAMNGGSVYDHIHLRDASGKEDQMAFLKLGQELWDPTMTRLTLLLDPGRIKRGVSLNLELGPALEAGKNYSLTIDADWKDSNGRPLQAVFTKAFRVGPSDRTAIDTAKWRVTAPRRATRDVLEIAFPEPLDHALAMRLIRVVDAKGANVPGDVATADQDRRWTFRPDANWPAGRYEIVVFTTIEDLAGNNVGKPFDVDVFENVQRELPSETVKLPFEVK